MPAQHAGLSIHPGIVTLVVLVAVAMIVAAVLIIRKYCLRAKEATWRYSALRRMEEHGWSLTAGDRGPLTAGEESDEDLLE